MNKKIIIFVFALIMLAVSCKTTKTVADTATDASLRQLVKNMENAAFDFKYFSAKAKVNFQDKSMNQSFTANIKMKKDETIWMSLTGPFGIEGGRVLIEKDRIQIIDRLNRVYYDKPFNYISNFLPFKVDLPMLQNIILGNPIQDNLSKQEIEIVENNYLVRGSLNKIDALYFILPAISRYKRVELSESNPSRNFTLEFDDYKQAEGVQFSHIRKLNFTENQGKVIVDINFQKIKRESTIDFPFSIPDNFKKAD
jgi:outer membrane lipoprotein-sorting protein